MHITAPIPPSVNHYMGHRAIMKNGRPMAVQYKTAEAVKFCKEFSAVIKKAVSEQGWDIPPESRRHIYVDALFYFPRMRMDCNNYWKVLLDTVTDTQLIWKDDDVVCERAQGIFYDAGNPRIELTIHPVDYFGVFENEDALISFEEHCKTCNRYARNCKLLGCSKDGRIQKEIINGVCKKYTPVKNK